jgi:hypothetical protein
LKNMTFYIYEDETLANSTLVNLTGNTNSSLFNYTFVNETNYTWGCEVYSNESDYDVKNYSIIYDISYPNLTTISEAVSTTSVTITWNTNEETNYSLTLQNLNNTNFSNNYTLDISGLSASTNYEYNLTYCDRAGNCNSTTRSFRTGDIPVVRSSGGGGGSGGSTQNRITVTQLSQGYNKKYTLGDKVSFVSGAQNHSLQLNKIINNSVNITIRSEPIILIMQTGDEKKINLTSTEYYDLYIKIENVTRYNANITIKSIEELINPHRLIKYDNQTNETDKGKRYGIFDEKVQNNERSLLPLYITLVLLICVFFYFLLRKKNGKKGTKKE